MSGFHQIWRVVPRQLRLGLKYRTRQSRYRVSLRVRFLDHYFVNDMQNCSDKLKFYLFSDDTNLLYTDRKLKSLETVVNCKLLSVYLVNCKQIIVQHWKMQLYYFPPLSKKAQQCVYLSANRFSMAWENAIQMPFTFFVFAWHWKQIWILLSVFHFRLTLYISFFVFASLWKTDNKVAEHSFGSLWVYVICQIMERERLQLKSWNWQVKNILMKDFDWQVKCDVFVVSMATWTIEYNLKIPLLLSLHKIRSLDFL